MPPVQHPGWLLLLSSIEENEPFMYTADAHNLMYHERIIPEEFKHFFLMESFNDDEEACIVCVGSPQNDGSILKKLLHKCGVLSPAELFTACFSCYPGGARLKKGCEGLFHGFPFFCSLHTRLFYLNQRACGRAIFCPCSSCPLKLRG